MPEPPIRCPAIEHPDLPLADPANLDPLLDRLAAGEPVSADETFPIGTLRVGGRVDLCKQGLGVPGVTRLLAPLLASGHAVHLLLGTNAIGNEGAAALAGALVPGHGVQTLYLGCNRIGGEGAATLARRLASDSGVRALWLKRNPVGDTGARALAGMLRSNHTIRTLDLVNTGITADGLSVLLAALLVRPRPLERLYLGGNGLGPSTAGLLAALIRDAGVRELYLTSNHLGDAGVAVLAGAASASKPVCLGLGGNGIGPEGALALAAALGGVEALELGRAPSERALGAPPNHTGDEGAEYLAAALPGSPLRRLDLTYTGITARGAKTLLAAIGTDTNLEHVALGGGVPHRVKRQITPRLRPASGVHPDLRAIASIYR
jgi:Ran GTPase-activating protein (RanGAP) involved in mRNA processing and transport